MNRPALGLASTLRDGNPSQNAPDAPCGRSAAPGGVLAPVRPSRPLERSTATLPDRSCTDCARLVYGESGTPLEGYVRCRKDLLGLLPASADPCTLPALRDDGDTTWVRLGRAVLDAPCYAYTDRYGAEAVEDSGNRGDEWRERRREQKSRERARMLDAAPMVPCPVCGNLMKAVTTMGLPKLSCSYKCAARLRDAKVREFAAG